MKKKGYKKIKKKKTINMDVVSTMSTVYAQLGQTKNS